MSEGTIVTFYSYKGGVGRTFALANIGALLSLWGYNTLCVDWDLEAPGLHLYFKSWLNKSNRHGLTELIQSHVEGEKPDWQKYVSKVNIPHAKASLYLMSAGLQDNTYIQRMQALNWTELYENHTLGNFLEELRENWKETLDFVLIDSRTGISDIGSICTVQLPDLLVVLLTANDQSLYGSLDVLQSIEQVHTNLPLDRAKLWIMPVVSRFEGRVEYTLAQEWLAIFAKALAPLYAEWAHKDVTASDLLNFTRIPYVPYWSFGEKLPVIEKGTEDPEDIGFLLETLASLVARKFSHSDVLIKNRNSFVALAKRGPIEASVLISFTPSDEQFAERLKRDIEARGFTTRSTFHEQQFDLASQEDTLGQMIRTSQLIVLIVSPHMWPANVVNEYRRTSNRYERRLVFVLTADDDRATLQSDDWGTVLGVDLIDARQTQYEIALDEIITRIEKGESLISPLELNLTGKEPRNPYKGLHTFTAQDARDFFGREHLIKELIDKLRHILTLERPGMAIARMLSVIGPSGSGKSSVVMAGLLPELQDGALPESQEWIYLEPMMPGRHPLEALTLTLSEHLPDMSLKTIREDLEDESARGLHLIATKFSMQQRVKVVLFVDQFEELFTQTNSEDERRHFLDLLMTATTEHRGSVIVLLTLRADFYDHPMYYPQLFRLIDDYHTSVLPMSISELREVIEQPATLPDVRLTFEGNLVSDLLSEVQGQVGALPLLQFTLQQLYQRRRGRQLTLAAYRELGGIKGALTRQAEEAYLALPSDEHRKLARVLFMRLIEPGDSEQDTIRRRAAISEFSLPQTSQTRLLQEVAKTFIAARLLTTNEIAGTTTIEVSHEALIHEWSRLASWRHEAHEDIRLQQTISKDVVEWEQRGKPRERLYRGSQLKEAQEWARRNTPSGNEVAFLQAGSAQVRATRLLYFVISTLIVLLVLLLLLLLLFLSGHMPKFV